MNQFNPGYPMNRPPPPQQFLQNRGPQPFAPRPLMWSQPRQPFMNGRGQNCPRGPRPFSNNNFVPNNMHHPPMNNYCNREDVFGYNVNIRPSNSDMRQCQPNKPFGNPVWQNEPDVFNNSKKHGRGGKFNNKNNSNRPQWTNNHHNNRNNNTQTNNSKKNKKKPKIDKRDLAENNTFFCDTCDRGYKDEDKYHEHINSHIKCRFEGCSYIAHPKLVQLHINLQHRSGLAKKIWQLESQEDIQKWRNERKRNYPTAENIERKKKMKEDKEARGEVIETKQFGKMQKKGKKEWMVKRKEAKKQMAVNRKRASNQLQEDGDTKEDLCSEGKVQKLDNVIRSCESEKDNQDNKTTVDGDPLSVLSQRSEAGLNKTDTNDLGIVGGLGTLMASYSDSGDSEDDSSEINNNNHTGSENVGSSKRDSEDKKDNFVNTKRNRKRQKGRKNKKTENGPAKIRKSTLLEKLLAPDIRHERNVLLQCVHFIVKKNFFKPTECDETINKSETVEDVEIWEH